MKVADGFNQLKNNSFLILNFVLIVIITFTLWSGVLKQALIGEGPTYFSEPYLSMLNEEPLKVLWSRHDSQALIFFHFVKDIFKDNMFLYMLSLLIGVSFVNCSLFILIRKITQSYLAGIIGVLLFSANYLGSFEILGLGYYQWFIQRVPNFGIALLSLILLYEYSEDRKYSHYFAALFLYLLSVFLARYTIHILPLFLLFIFFKNVLEGQLPKRLLKFVLESIPFVIGTYILIKAQTLISTTSTDISFSALPSKTIDVLHQLTFITAPFLKTFYINANTRTSVEYLTPVISLIYTLTSVFILKNALKENRNFRSFFLALIISLPLSIFLSIYLNPVFLNYYDSSRYLYYCSLLFSIFWGIVLRQLAKIAKITTIFVFAFLFIWVFYNNFLISQEFKVWQERHDPVIATINFMREKNNTLGVNTIIAVPEGLGNYGSHMLEYFYGRKEHIIADPEELERVLSKIDQTYILYLKYNALTKNIDPYKEKYVHQN